MLSLSGDHLTNLNRSNKRWKINKISREVINGTLSELHFASAFFIILCSEVMGGSGTVFTRQVDIGCFSNGNVF